MRCLHTPFEWHRLSGDRDTRRKWSGFPAPTEYPRSETHNFSVTRTKWPEPCWCLWLSELSSHGPNGERSNAA